MTSKSATLKEILKFYEDNEELYMRIARENTKYDSLGRIILEDYGDDDSDWETEK